LDVKFNIGFGEDIGKKLVKEKEEREEKEQEGGWQAF